MEREYISLHKLGVGPILVRYTDISTMEPTIEHCTRIDLANGQNIIVSDDIKSILNKIGILQLINEQNISKE